MSNLQDPLSRVSGVGDTQVFGSQYAMRVWVDPLKLNNYALTMTDVTTAIQAQNAQVSAGQIGAQPAPAHGRDCSRRSRRSAASCSPSDSGR